MKKKLLSLLTGLILFGHFPLVQAQENGTPYDTYPIESGETLYAIANLLGYSIEELMAFNGLSSTFIYAGQELQLPPKDDQPHLSNGHTYTVQTGDTLYSIGRQFGVSIADIQALNALPSNLIHPGQVLTISTFDPEPPFDQNGNSFEYIIQKGETLYSIALQFGITIEDILAVNALHSTTIYPGQVLTISQNITEPISQEGNVIEHIVQKGDTLYSISRKYGISIEKIMLFNDLPTDLLRIGQSLGLPL